MTLYYSRIRWPRNPYDILQGFGSEFWWLDSVSNNSDDYWIYQELDDHGILMKFSRDFDQNSGIWPQNSYEIHQNFLSEFWWPALLSNNSDDYQILQKLDDRGIFVKFFKDFDQNSGGQP